MSDKQEKPVFYEIEGLGFEEVSEEYGMRFSHIVSLCITQGHAKERYEAHRNRMEQLASLSPRHRSVMSIHDDDYSSSSSSFSDYKAELMVSTFGELLNEGSPDLRDVVNYASVTREKTFNKGISLEDPVAHLAPTLVECTEDNKKEFLEKVRNDLDYLTKHRQFRAELETKLWNKHFTVVKENVRRQKNEPEPTNRTSEEAE